MAAIIKCKMCGGDLELTEGSSIATCEYCGTQQTVPSMDNDKKLVQFERADRLRRLCEFDKAAGVYESIVTDFRQEAEAYWGLVLCKYGIEYVDDPASGKKVPTCHRSSFESILEDSNFEQVLENADSTARKVYREEAKAIEEIRKGILEVSSKEDPYDIFICYKETAENGDRTLDSVLAQDLYDALTDKGYRVFFSRITLEDKLGQEYEPYIFAALNSAKVMLAVGTDYDYYNAVWVKNEWSRYLKLMEKDKEKHLIPCFKGIDAYDMPKEFARLQGQDLGKMGAVQDILRNMEKYIARKDGASVVHDVQKVGLDDKVTDLLDQGYQAMDEKQWAKADALFEEALKASANTPDRFLIEQNVRQAREKTQFQLRRKKNRKINGIMAAILAVFQIIFMKSLTTTALDMVYAFADDGFIEVALPIARWIYWGLCFLVLLSTCLGMAFVGKTSGAKSFWGGLSRVLSVLGFLFTIGFAMILKYAVKDSDEVVIPLYNWLINAGILHGVNFVALFFRRKL